MRKVVFTIAILFCLGWGVGCSSKKDPSPNSMEARDTIVIEPSDTFVNKAGDNGEEEVYLTQLEMNLESYNGSMNYYKSVEEEYQKLISAYPKYKEMFENEKSVWREYYDAVNKVAGYGEYGSSMPMRINDIVNQSIKLREVSIHNLYLFSQGTSTNFCKTMFNNAMIEKAYTAFINITREMDERKLIGNEQKCWNNWLYCRETISKELPNKIKCCYDNCTNMVKRTKLLQLKNQNQGLGVVSGEIVECLLPNDCSDKELLEYPGFNVVWAKYLNNLE
ncbi:MAG: hypothetical protein J6W19_12420 [Prevotella sp.]|nr:hypothetical protein [Prevotella sp.]